MVLPELSPAEKRLGKFAALCSALYALAGFFFAALPEATLEVATLGAPSSPLGPQARFFQVLGVSAMAALSLACALVARSPRKRREALLPVLLAKLVSSAFALVLLAFVAPSSWSQTAWRALLFVFLADLSLFAATFKLYRAAAPGVNLSLETQTAPVLPQGTPGAPPVRLGISVQKG